MSLPGYKVPIFWIPDSDYINEPPDYEYLAWKMGTNEKEGTALWVITQVVEVPTVPLPDLLPVGYEEVSIDDDTVKFGFNRNLYPKKSISTVEEIINEQTGYVIDELV